MRRKYSMKNNHKKEDSQYPFEILPVVTMNKVSCLNSTLRETPKGSSYHYPAKFRMIPSLWGCVFLVLFFEEDNVLFCFLRQGFSV